MSYLIVADWDGNNKITRYNTRPNETAANALVNVLQNHPTHPAPNAFAVVDPGHPVEFLTVDPVAETVSLDTTAQTTATDAPIIAQVAALQKELLALHDAIIARHYSQTQANTPPLGSPNTVTVTDSNAKVLEWLEWAQDVREANDSGTPSEQLAALQALTIPT